MTKLEEKLLELGYEKYSLSNYLYTKEVNFFHLDIELSTNLSHIVFSEIDVSITVINQQDIDNLQQAFNVLKKDLEVLKDGR